MHRAWRGWLGAGGLVVAGVGVAVGMSPRQAQACGACLCEGQGVPLSTWPRAGARDVPLNARLFVSLMGGQDPSGLQLATAGGVRVPFRLEPTGGPAHTHWLVPESPLAARTEYVLSVGAAREGFQTADGVDEEPPQAPTVQVDATHGSLRGLCTPGVGAALTLSNPSGGNAVSTLLAEVEVPSVGRKVLVPLLQPTLTFGHAAPTTGGDATASLQDCLGEAELGEVAEGPTRVVVRLVDFAGNTSPPVTLEAVPFTRVEPAGCSGPEGDGTSASGGLGARDAVGCASAGNGVLPLGALTFFFGLSVRRRRPQP